MLNMAPAMQHGADNLVLALKRVTVPITGLDRSLDGLRIDRSCAIRLVPNSTSPGIYDDIPFDEAGGVVARALC